MNDYSQRFPKEFLERLSEIPNKRAKTVIDHILEHGFITTEDLQNYGYNHPPRAVMDVKDEGIPIERFRVKSSDGRTIAAYRFGDPTTVRRDRIGGRQNFSKKFKQNLIEANGSKCAVCFGQYEDRYLQIDHRIPYEVSGDPQGSQRNIDDYMLICGSCNRAKSWSCEHCINWQEKKDPNICRTCYWGSPQSYQHIALREIRRLDVIWNEEEIAEYEEAQRQAAATNISMPEFVKTALKSHVQNTDE